MNIIIHTSLLVSGPNCVRTCPTGVRGTAGGLTAPVVGVAVLVRAILIVLTVRATGRELLFVAIMLFGDRLRDLTVSFSHRFLVDSAALFTGCVIMSRVVAVVPSMYTSPYGVLMHVFRTLDLVDLDT